MLGGAVETTPRFGNDIVAAPPITRMTERRDAARASGQSEWGTRWISWPANSGADSEERAARWRFAHAVIAN